jgi:hypothetical protein
MIEEYWQKMYHRHLNPRYDSLLLVIQTMSFP